MMMFDYVIKDELGIHARPAGLIVKEATQFSSVITLQKGEKKADAKKIFSLMGLGAKQSDTITITCEGEDEAAVYETLKQLFETSL